MKVTEIYYYNYNYYYCCYYDSCLEIIIKYMGFIVREKKMVVSCPEIKVRGWKK